MSVSLNIPEITALRTRVEGVFGASLQTHNAFIALADAIDKSLREHVSESTLERLWGYSTREVASISVRTLDVLSRFSGFPTWKAFIESLKDGCESEEFAREGIADDLRPGQILQLGWLPNRLITVRLEADGRYVVVESRNSSLRPGDSFMCNLFQLGRPLYMDRFRRSGSSKESCYVAGERSGLTTLAIIS